MAEQIRSGITIEDLIALQDAWVEIVNGEITEITAMGGRYKSSTSTPGSATSSPTTAVPSSAGRTPPLSSTRLENPGTPHYNLATVYRKLTTKNGIHLGFSRKL